MEPKAFYQYLYRKLNKRTPLKTDCGSLCSNACCVDREGEVLGMYLFPFEEEVLSRADNLTIEESDFIINERPVKIAFCKPYCDRRHRPLSCRIFPLFPYVSRDGEMQVIIDPRSRECCPLHRLEVRELSSRFVRGVRHVAKLLMLNETTREFLYETSRLIDEELEFLSQFLENEIPYLQSEKNVLH